jgi:hypothetical protein
MSDAVGNVAAAPRRKTSIMTRWPTEENPSAIFLQSQQPAYSEPHWLPPVDYEEDEEETNNSGKPNSTISADDRSLEFQQQQALSLEERQMRRKISISNITGKVKMPSRRRSVIEFSAEFQRDAAAAAAAAAGAGNPQGLAHASGPHPQTVPE